MVSAPDFFLAIDHLLMWLVGTWRRFAPLFFHPLTTLIRPILLVLRLGTRHLPSSIAGLGGSTRR